MGKTHGRGGAGRRLLTSRLTAREDPVDEAANHQVREDDEDRRDDRGVGRTEGASHRSLVDEVDDGGGHDDAAQVNPALSYDLPP
jgi:hypothetical protein